MLSAANAPLYINIGNNVVAIDRTTGNEIWRRELQSSSFVTSGTFCTLLVTADAIYAGAHGELFCLAPATGEIRWHNPLKGLGTSLVVFAGSESAVAIATAATQASAMVAVNAATLG
ncbi:MAG TPA: PQQ-binding-like beta-propeller repeat protein [Thermoanaerobaculia bacterium]|jgi:outer membrane protein assembly factor BamB